MDLNDPRRRLQVAKASNPSLRIAVAPQQSQPTPITLSYQQPKGIALNYTTPVTRVASFTNAPQVQQPQQQQAQPQFSQPAQESTPLQVAQQAPVQKPVQRPSHGILDIFRPVSQGGINIFADAGNFVKDALVKPTVDFGSKAVNTAGVVSQAVPFALDRAAREATGTANDPAYQMRAKATEQALNEQLKNSFVSNDVASGKASVGQFGQEFAKTGAEGASYALPTLRVAQGANLVQRLAANVGANAAVAGTGDAAKQLTGTGNIDLLQLGKSSIAGGILGIIGARTPGSEKIIGKLADSISKETNPGVIKNALGVDDSVAEYLASETSKKSIEKVVREMSIDPNLHVSDNVRKQLQDEGITAVRQQDNPYGAEYNPNDRSISVRDQSFATDANLYHELGHDIWKTQLTPEERALFKDVNGPGAKQATGRAGYTPDDVMSEDFSDMIRKALTGRMNEVPPELQSVISKYAKVAVDKGAPSAPAGILPATTKTFTELPKNVGDNFVMADNAAPKLPEIQKRLGQINKKFTDVQQGKTSMTRDEINALAKEQEALIAQAQKPFESGYNALDGKPADAQAVAQQAEQVGKAQTGVADGMVAGSGDTVAPLHEDVGTQVDNLVGKDTKPEDVQKILDAATQAKASYGKAEAARSPERAARIQSANSAFDAAGGGEEGYRAMLSKLGGKYTQSDYVPISLDKQVSDKFLNQVKNDPKLMDWEKFNTQNALRKIWGANPEKPAAHDYNYIARFFNQNYGEGVGDEIVTSLQDAAAQGGDSYQNIVTNIAGLPRALMATGDLSGGFRQALPLGTRFPKIWANANKESVKYAVNPGYYKQEMKAIADAPDHNVISDKMGVDLTGVGAMQDEAFIGAGYAEHLNIPKLFGKGTDTMSTAEKFQNGYGFGTITQAADRAYTGVLTRIRYDVAHKLVEDAGGPEQFVKNMESLYGDGQVNKGLTGASGKIGKADRAMRSLGEVINTFTGRGGMKGGVLDKHMQTLSTTLFAPRLWAANIQRLNPVWYAKLARDNPQAAKLALQSQATFTSVIATVLGVASAAGATVGTDPRSADFLKIKIGNTRYDIAGGQQQNIVQAVRQITGEKVNSETGDVQTLGDTYGSTNRVDLAASMIENKSNPLLAFVVNLMRTKDNPDSSNPLDRKDQYGNDWNVADKTARLTIPLAAQGAYDTSVDVGDPVKGALLNAPSFLGVGVQTYGGTASKDQGTKQADGTTKFQGKVTPDMVLQDNGQPFLDSKGNVVRVKFGKNATDLEKQALLDEKKQSLLKDQFTKRQSTEDQALMKLSTEKLQDYVDEGKIDQTKADHILRLKKGSEDWGNQIKVDKGATSDYAKTFYSKYNSMTPKDQKAWLNQAPDNNAKQIATKINAERPSNLDEFKPSNKLSQLYAEYEKDVNTKQYDDFTREERTRKFQKDAYKLNFSDRASQIYNEGSSNDLKQKIDDGQISKADLDAALKMDADFYTAGISGKLTFGKKFRNTYGYATPDGIGSSGGGSSGSGGGRASKSAHLASLLPSFSQQEAAPKISAKRRTSGISFKDVNTPTKSTSRKVSIKL